jgi:tRNA G10  N-methylase Trm11
MNFYNLKNSVFTAELCRLEMKYLFNHTSGEKFLFSDRLISPSRSPFIKERLTVVYEGDSLDSLERQVLGNHFAAEDFRVNFLQSEGMTEEYQERLRSTRVLGEAIDGDADMHHPKVQFGVTSVHGRWYFGEYERNSFAWHHHDSKPHTYSCSLNFRMARALVNIGVGPDTGRTLIDPCCGVGTVVIEALSMGIDARGCEINPPIAISAKKNLAYFSLPDVITEGDMHGIQDHFDVAIVDIPYGLYQVTTAAEQSEIIRTARRIAGRLVLVTFENMDVMIREAGFIILDKIKVVSGKMVRYVQVCE